MGSLRSEWGRGPIRETAPDRWGPGPTREGDYLMDSIAVATWVDSSDESGAAPAEVAASS